MTVGKGKGSRYNRKVQIQRPVTSEAFKGAGSGAWEDVGLPVWVSIVDALPSRGEKLADGINVASRPSRVRMRFRTDVTGSMRFVEGNRIMEIVAGPAELGFRDELEFMVEDYTSAGNPA